MIVHIQNARVRHLEKTIFKNLNLKIGSGQLWSVIGDSGSGKTALLHTIYGNFNIVDGFVRYPDLQRRKKELAISNPLFTYNKMIAFVRQQAHFKDKENQSNFFYQQRYHAYFSQEAITVAEYIQEERSELDLEAELPVKFTVDWIIQHLKLEELLDKTLIQLSNGETKRLMIAKALLEQPVLLLMDNPLIGLDTETRPILKRLLKEILKKDTAIVMATSYREIPANTTHLAYLKDQGIHFSGTREEFERKGFNFAATASQRWKPNPKLLKEIYEHQPRQAHDFKWALRLANINVKSGGKKILENINWQVKKGEKWALAGHNGAGKSTLLSLINGDHPQAYSNEIYIFDERRGSGQSIWELKYKIGYVSPEMHQYFKGNHKVLEVVLSGLYDKMGISLDQVSQEELNLGQNWLSLLGLTNIKSYNFKELATGKQRLVLLLRALIKNPPLLILDEPCQGLDTEQKEHFKNLINQLWNRKEKTLIYVSHYKEDIPQLVSKVLELENGRTVN